MSDYSDMRRRAAQQASYGNYWAGKCVGLLDEIERLRAAITEAVHILDSHWVDPHDGQLDDARDTLHAALKGTTDDD